MPAYIGDPPRLRALRDQDSARRGAEGGSPSGPPPGGLDSALHAELPDTGLVLRDRGVYTRSTAEQSNRLFAGLILIGLGCLLVFAGIMQFVELKRDVRAGARDAAATRDLLEQKGGCR
jgi:hypothetical protein